jgi:MFS family permease
MFKAVRPVTQVLLAVAFMEAGLGVLSPLISLDLAQKSVSTSLIGIVTSGYFTGFLLGTLSCHWVIDRVGHIRAFAVFAAVAGNATLGHIIFDQPYAWIALRALLGYAFAGQFVVIESWLNDKAADDNRGRIFPTIWQCPGPRAASARSPSISTTRSARPSSSASSPCCSGRPSFRWRSRAWAIPRSATASISASASS